MHFQYSKIIYSTYRLLYLPFMFYALSHEISLLQVDEISLLMLTISMDIGCKIA